MKDCVAAIFNKLFIDYPDLGICRDSIAGAFNILKTCYEKKGKVLICGNGGSAADSEHIAAELMKGFLLKREIPNEHKSCLKLAFPSEWEYLSERLQKALPAISLVSQPALSTAIANDNASDMVFAQQVYGYGNEGDVLLCISTSGSSQNVVNAAKVAYAFGLKTIGMTGNCRGALNDLCDVVIMVPASETYKVQEYHLPVYHALCAMLEAEFFA